MIMNYNGHTRHDLLRYQEEVVSEIEDYDGRVLCTMDMGLGKTIVSLEYLRRNPQATPALIICPASVKYNWEYEAFRHLGTKSSICEGQTPPKWNPYGFDIQSPLTIINYDILSHWVDYLKNFNFKTIILDECQFCANPDAQRTKATKHMTKGCKHLIALSGTPLLNKPIEMFPVLNMLWPKEYPYLLPFARRFGNPTWTPWGWDYSGASNLDILHRQLTVQGMVRRRKEVLTGLPEMVRRVVPCELSDKNEYLNANNDFISWLKRTSPDRVLRAQKSEALAKVGYLLRLAARLKLRSVVDWSNRFLEETGEKLVLFGVHRKCIEALKRRVKAESVVVDGSTAPRDRHIAVRQFQSDSKVKVFIGNIHAAGVGITLTAASTLAFAEMYWRPGDHIQAEGRIHRIGQQKTSWVHYLVSGDTIEERLCRILQKKQEVISSVLDGGPTPDDLSIHEELLRALTREAIS